MEQIEHPFTPEQVAALEEHQRGREYHPFTCPNRGDGKHGEIDGDKGILVPTVRGWICRYCDYTQDWAHAFMAGSSPSEPPKGTYEDGIRDAWREIDKLIRHGELPATQHEMRNGIVLAANAVAAILGWPEPK